MPPKQPEQPKGLTKGAAKPKTDDDISDAELFASRSANTPSVITPEDDDMLDDMLGDDLRRMKRSARGSDDPGSSPERMEDEPMEDEDEQATSAAAAAAAAPPAVAVELSAEGQAAKTKADEEARKANEEAARAREMADAVKGAATWIGRTLYRTGAPLVRPNRLGLTVDNIEYEAEREATRYVQYEDAALFMMNPPMPWRLCRICANEHPTKECPHKGTKGLLITCPYQWCPRPSGDHLPAACPALNGRCFCGRRGHLDDEASPRAPENKPDGAKLGPCEHPDSQKWFEENRADGWLTRRGLKGSGSRYRAAGEYKGPATVTGAEFRHSHILRYLLERKAPPGGVTTAYMDGRFPVVEPWLTERLAFHALAKENRLARENRKRSYSSSTDHSSRPPMPSKKGRYDDAPSKKGRNDDAGSAAGQESSSTETGGSRRRSRNRRGGGGRGGGRGRGRGQPESEAPPAGEAPSQEAGPSRGRGRGEPPAQEVRPGPSRGKGETKKL